MGFPCVDTCLESLTQDVYGFVKRRWLILYHFKKNFAVLKEEKEELERQRGKVQEQVDKAKEQGEEIIKEVSEWMVDMEKTKKEVDVLLQEKTGRESIVCFRLGFPNYISRYRLSKRAEEKKVDVQKKIKVGTFSAVSGPAPPPPELQLPPTIGEYQVFESRAAVLKEIKDALKENNVVGIHGAGGVGKTIMAAEVIKQLQSEGYIHEFAIAVVSQYPDVERIQGKLASCLNDFQLDEKENKEERAKKLWNRLKNGKSNLVLLDDLWGMINLREIGIPVSVGNNECKLLITSRLRQEVWKHNNWESKLLVKQIRVEELNRQEAWELFKNHAGDSIETSEVHSIALKVCEKCGGLPVAISAVGRALCNKDLYGWEDALDKLKNYEMERIFDIDDELFPSLKLSYEMLSDKEAQRCFLLCCLFPEDSEIPVEQLVLHCQAAGLVGTVKVEETRNRVNALIGILKSRCLLLDVLDVWGRHTNKVKVHDVIRDIGIAISKKGNESLRLMHGFRGGTLVNLDTAEPYIAMWLRKSDFEDDHSFPGDVGTLVLDWYGSSFEDDHTLLQRVNKFLCGTIRSLKVLVLNGLNISSVFPPSSSGGESLPNLRMLWLDTWKEDDAAVLRHLQKLKVFRLTDCGVEELPAEIGLLKELLVLDLKELYGLEKIPSGVLSKLTRLEELHLPLDFRGWENGGNENGISENASISELSCLKRLTTISAFFPNCDLSWANDIFFGKLNRFDIRVGSTSDYGTIVYSKGLKLVEVSITNKFNGLICKADVLAFHRVNGLSEAIHGTSHGFPHLKELRIEGCHDLNYVFTEPCARALPQLRILKVRDCESLVSIVEGNEEEILEQDQGGDIVYFGRLEELYLKELPNLVATYIRGKIVYPALKGCNFRAIHGFPCLKKLRISGCPNLNYVFTEPGARALPQLRKLRVKKCQSLVSIVVGIEEEISEQDQGGDIIYFHRLEELELRFLPNLVGFHSWVKTRTSAAANGATYIRGKIVYPALEKLLIEGCRDLNYVFTEPCARALPQLRYFEVKECESLVSIVGGIEEEISEQDQGGDIIYFPRLEELTLLSLPNLVGFHSWVKNRISAATDGATYIGGKIVYPALEKLLIEGCRDLNYVFTEPCARALPQLRYFEVKECESLVSIVGGIEEEISEQDQGGDIIYFPRLEELTLLSLPNLVGFHSWVKNRTSAAADGATYIRGKIVYPALEKLLIKGCCKLNYVFIEPCARGLPQLRYFEVKECESLVSIVGGTEEENSEQDQGGDIIYFRRLEELVLGGLPNLVAFHSWVKNRTSAAADGATSVFFSGKIVYPALEKLVISGCDDLNYVFTEPCARALPQLRHLEVWSCERLVSIVGGIEEEISEQDQGGDIIYFGRLEELELRFLKNLVGFHSWVKNRTSAAADGATSVFFSGKIVYPALEKLRIEGCHDLNYVFTEPCARALPQLRYLVVRDCESLVSIVGGIEEEISEQDQGGDIIYFGRLEEFCLTDLPNLVGFHSGVKNRTSAAADGATYIRGKIVYPALEVCRFWYMPKATEVFKSRILPQLTGQDSKEICQQENDFQSQGVSLPSLAYLGILDRNIKMPEEISFTPVEHGIRAIINETKKEGVDKTMFQPLFDAVLGFGCE